MITPLAAAVFALGATDLAHVSHTFSFVLDAPITLVAPLFGPQGERAWAGESWDPVFLYPAAPADIEGAVFTTQAGGSEQLWVNTVFDVSAGRMQYVTFLPGVMTTTIDVTVRENEGGTGVVVRYQRTALTVDANERVAAAGLKDAESGPRWQAAISAALLSD